MARVKALGDVASVHRRDHEIRCKGAVTVDTEDRTVFANVSVSLVAARAIPAGKVALDSDEVANFVG